MNLGAQNSVMGPNPGDELAARMLRSLFMRGSIKKNYACIDRMLEIWNWKNSHYASLEEFFADIQAEGDLDRLNQFLLKLGGEPVIPTLQVYRLFLRWLMEDPWAKPHIQKHCREIKEPEKLSKLIDNSLRHDPDVLVLYQIYPTPFEEWLNIPSRSILPYR